MTIIRPTDELLQLSSKFTEHLLKNSVVVFDGSNGRDFSSVTLPSNSNQDKNVICTRIIDGGLKICYPSSFKTGLIYQKNEEDSPSVVLLSRKDALRINRNGRDLCSAMKTIMRKRPDVKRGQSKSVFLNDRYCVVGAKPRRSSPGVDPGHFKIEDGIDNSDWNVLVKAVRGGEHAFLQYTSTVDIGRIRDVRNLVGWEGVKSSSGNGSCDSKIFNGIAFGVNVHLRAHVDHDFTYSVIQAHVDGVDDSADDPSCCYFCFPRLGLVIPLRPSDFLLIDALEYHCLI